MTDDIARNRFFDTYGVILGIIMIVSSVLEPPHGWWRVLVYVVLPIILIIMFGLRLIKSWKH